MAQDEKAYQLVPAPDVWYNDVDGIRAGIRLIGEVPGTFNDGPHRLDAGIWLGTWFPDNPISYYFSFLEPIPSISSFGNEGSVEIESSVRTGYSKHKLAFNKRWQKGFDELRYVETSLFVSKEKLFDGEYRPFPVLWQNNWKTLLGFEASVSGENLAGRFGANFTVKQNVDDHSENFTVTTLEILQRVNINRHLRLRIRGFGGLASENTAPEYLFVSSFNPAQYWLDNGISRAKGTIPQPWLKAGSFHVGGGANLRGYLNRDIDLLKDGFNPSYRHIWAFNSELEFPNPMESALNGVSIVGDIVHFRSYLFFDLGKGYEQVDSIIANFENTLADAGLGLLLSANLPDFLGKDRGIFIRYDLPFWLSDPEGGDSNFRFRQLIGLGAFISF